MKADDDMDDDDPVRDAVAVWEGEDVVLVLDVVVCCGAVEVVDIAAAAADFSISSNSRLKIDNKHPIR